MCVVETGCVISCPHKQNNSYQNIRSARPHVDTSTGFSLCFISVYSALEYPFMVAKSMQ